MTGFHSDWLALREPVDHAAVNHALRMALCRHFADHTLLNVVDLGSGTGSNFRSLAPDLPQRQRWSLIDNDAGLLEIARMKTNEAIRSKGLDATVETRVIDLSSAGLADCVSEAELVTASALFDLISPDWIRRFVSILANSGATFYTTLTYDGIAFWSPAQPVDEDMRDAFNNHQQTDKGFGPAAGPHATKLLKAAFEEVGYSVDIGNSPWVLDETTAELRSKTDEGWAAAVTETGRIDEAKVSAWLRNRNSPDAVTIVGHKDLLARPPI